MRPSGVHWAGTAALAVAALILCCCTVHTAAEFGESSSVGDTGDENAHGAFGSLPLGGADGEDEQPRQGVSDDELREMVARGEIDISLVPWLKERYQGHVHFKRRMSRAHRTFLERRQRSTESSNSNRGESSLEWSVAHPPLMFINEPHWQGKEMPWEEENRVLDEFHNAQCIVDDERDAYHAACFGPDDSFQSCTQECCDAFHSYYAALTTDDCIDGMMDFLPTRQIISKLVAAHNMEIQFHCPHMYHHDPVPAFGEVARRRRAVQEDADRARRQAEENARISRGAPRKIDSPHQFGQTKMETVRIDDL
eukprot:Opistho-2@26484